MRPRRRWDNGLDSQHSGMRRHVAPDAGQDFDGLRVRPVVDDIHQQVGVGSRHSVGEEIAANHGELLTFFRRDSGYYVWRSVEHTSELQSRLHLVCRLLLDTKTQLLAATRPT